MIIREYNSNDKKEVIDLWKKVFKYDSPHNSPELSIEKKTAHSDGLFLVAEDNGKITGTVLGGYDGHRGWIYSLAVEPVQQRQGTGTKLLKAIEQKIIALGCVKINLQVLKDNENVISFYHKNGYDTEDRISMGKKLY